MSPLSEPSPTSQPVLVAGRWRPADVVETYQSVNPATGESLPDAWPVSRWSDVEEALDAATAAAGVLAATPGEQIAGFLERYARRLEGRGDDLVAAAHAATGLATTPRLADIELPRTLDQLRQAAAAARSGDWRLAVIDSSRNIRSAAFPLGPVVVLPPSNFPLAFGCLTGGDFAAAFAAGCPVIAKAHPGHPAVSQLAAGEAVAALGESGLPAASIQLIHGLGIEDGERLVADARVGATAFTGGERAGRRLFAAASAAGRPIWVEMGSLNPVVLLPAAIASRAASIADELTTSVTGSAGQLCTKPGLVFLVDDEAGRGFVEAVAERFRSVAPQLLLGPPVRERLDASLATLERAGARRIAGAEAAAEGCRHAATLLETTASEFIGRGELLGEAFGNATLLVRCDSLDELAQAIERLPGTLAASLYSDAGDEQAVGSIAARLAAISGRLIENRMPTGLAVSPAMHHGGPWPAAGPPFFSAVGLPFSMLRFARRICYDGCSPLRLPDCLADAVPPGSPWRMIDGTWTRQPVGSVA